MARFAKLRREWMLRGWIDVPMALINWTTGDRRNLQRKGFYVAECCDGHTDFDSLGFLPEHHVLLDKLIKESIVEICHEGDSIETWQRYRKAENPHITGIHWCLTGLCNLNCRHCYMEAPTGRYGVLPFEEMVQFIEQFERAGVVEVLLTGGEPFLRRDLLDILEVLAQKKIRVSEIYSNGLLITDRHLDRIRRFGFSPVFQISFDGVGGHDLMRGRKGVEQKTINGIRKLLAAGFQVAVGTSIDKLNIGSLVDTYELMKRLGVDSWSVVPPLELGNWRRATTAITLDEAAMAYRPVLDRWLSDGKPFNVHLAPIFKGRQQRRGSGLTRNPSIRAQVSVRATSGENVRSEANDDQDSTEGQEREKYTPDTYDCYPCREQPNLLPDGTLVPCPGYVDSSLMERMPNLRRDELSKIWTTSFLREIADLKKKDLFERNPECATCELFEECGGGCRVSALMKTGDLMAKDPVSCALWRNGLRKVSPATQSL